jgi:hypothetical protein
VSEYALRPGFGYFDDGSAPNAIALPDALLPGGPDGTVLIGTALLDREVSAAGDDAMAAARAAVILAHEFGHIVQYHNGLSPGGPWQMELHADFLAGWALARQLNWRPPPAIPEAMPALPPIPLVFLQVFGNASALQAMFEVGDTDFTSPVHHGTPQCRRAMVQSGYAAAALDFKAAFDKGKELSGLDKPSAASMNACPG